MIFPQPLWAGNEAYGLLQIRFSLETLHLRVRQAQRLTLIYVIVYGLVLALFAVYLLNRNVVRPVRQLQEATTTVAAGELNPVVVPSGPGEIHELADSFNRMVAALAASRTETEEHIASLEEINQALARARDDLVRSEKLATVGHLAAGMAHEIGNPLGAVVGYLNLLKDDLTGDARDLVDRSLSETGRIDRLIRELLEYSAPIDRQTESFCPISLLRETVEMLRHQGQFDGVEIEDHCSGSDCLVSMDRGRLMQVWINLLLNARDAMQGRGWIELTSQQADSSISVSIRDGGAGVDPDVAKRIFEPFFTTKAPGSGYGLGLAVCQRIVDENGGRIELASDPGQGACFTVTLPCIFQENIMTATKRQILIVDDEAPMRHMLRMVLERDGYAVSEAVSGRQGLDRLRSGHYDLVLCDIRMPEMDGLTFLKEKQEQQFGGTVIMMSAYGSIDTAVECMKKGAYDYISKPFRPDEILLTVRKAEERLQLRQENVQLKKNMRRGSRPQGVAAIVHRSAIMQNVLETVQKASADHGGGADHRADRHRQGINCPGPACGESALRQTLPGGQLQRHSCRLARE